MMSGPESSRAKLTQEEKDERNLGIAKLILVVLMLVAFGVGANATPDGSPECHDTKYMVC